MKANQKRYQGIVGYPFLQALINCITSVKDIYFPTDLCIFLLGFVSTYFYALLYWEFSHRFTHNLVAFCREISYTLLLKSLPGLFFFPCQESFFLSLF